MGNIHTVIGVIFLFLYVTCIIESNYIQSFILTPLAYFFHPVKLNCIMNSLSCQKPNTYPDFSSLTQELVSNYTTSSYILLGMKSIGIDYGLTRTGLAITSGYSFKPLKIISNPNSTVVCTEILKQIKHEQISRVIIGLPICKYENNESCQAIRARDFARVLLRYMENYLTKNVPEVYLWDERYTSKEAEARARIRNPHNSQQLLDDDAACLILNDYYERNGNGGVRVHSSQNLSENT